MPPTRRQPSSAAADAASQPEIEDLVKSEASDAIAGAATAVSTQHHVSKHDFQPHELLATRTELLAWYDAHRRKLPWRGDPPPYLTTATHTSQKKQQEAAKRSGLAAFLKQEPTDEAAAELEHVEAESCKQEEVVEAAGGDDSSESRPKKVAPYETWVSEIMLQQTRVDTVVEYFLRWIDKFPTVAVLAEANEEVCGENIFINRTAVGIDTSL
ncbi:unnamed protein product [Phytophthora fragariaefolia]|uniref:Unnamed protein product n=1 Tax=Phytophthora fragariaefolia TaxID=1490495 RepID=A0A9W6UF16_9STRA|nr:unnamed protein product [Phytophthora fragariaefolia]